MPGKIDGVPRIEEASESPPRRSSKGGGGAGNLTRSQPERDLIQLRCDRGVDPARHHAGQAQMSSAAASWIQQEPIRDRPSQRWLNGTPNGQRR